MGEREEREERGRKDDEKGDSSEKERCAKREDPKLRWGHTSLRITSVYHVPSPASGAQETKKQNVIPRVYDLLRRSSTGHKATGLGRYAVLCACDPGTQD